VLDFLVTSKARRRVLQLLFRGQCGSASTFAERASIGFASAYRELHAMRDLGLVTSERENGAEVFRLDAAHPLAEPLRALVLGAAQAGRPGEGRPDEGRPDEGQARVRRQLRALGAPLQVDAAEPPEDSVEKVLVEGVRLAHQDPAVARSLPVCLYALREVLDAGVLQRQALALSEKRALGFFLDLTAALSGDRRFSSWARPLRDRRCTATRDFFHGVPDTALHREAARRNTPAPARRWHYRMNMNLDAFASTFRKFARDTVLA
jgi:hypothetical protein